MADYELYHSGVKGMKWGIRRYQNKDGSLTPAGRKRYGYGQRVLNNTNKVVSKAAKRFKSAVDSHKAKKIAEKEAAEREAEETKKKNRPIRDLSDAELKEKINRLTLERQALDLERQVSNLDPKRASSGESFIRSIGSKVITPALMDAGKRVATDFLNKKGRELLGLSDNDMDPAKALKKTVDELNLKKQKNELDKYFEREERKKAEAESKGSDSNKQSNKQQSNKQSGNDSSGKKEKVHEGEVIGEGNSRRGSKKAANDDDEIIIEDDTVLPAIRNTKKHDRGRKWINEMFDY